MRDCAKNRGIPILTITQDNRGSEDRTIATFSDVGGSIKKVRYCDLLINIKQRDNIGVLDPQVSADINISSLTNQKMPIIIENDVIPFEVTITKNKNGNRGMSRFHMFCKTNLKIYSDASHYINDLKKCATRSKEMADKLELIEISNSNCISSDFEDDRVI